MAVVESSLVVWVVLMGSVFQACSATVSVLSLTGAWVVSDHTEGVSVIGQVPGSMYTALLDNKQIPDPLYRDNDVKLADIGHANWTYSRFFDVSGAMLQSASVLLVAEGIDTVSSVFINEQQVGVTDNMFVKYTWDVKPLIKLGTNKIRVSFQSATDYATKTAGGYPYPVPPNCSAPVQHGECHVNFIRKEQCSFSWDWGPSFPTQGIWKPIYLEAFHSAVMDSVTVEVEQDSSGTGWELGVRAFFNVDAASTVTGQLQIKLDGTAVTHTSTLTLSSANSMAAVNVSVPQSAGVKRWWPNGYGNQTLYDVYVTFVTADGELSSRHKRVGFRTVELVQDPVSADPKQGLTFYFRVNGFPLFLKGSNWIPADSFQERITKERLRNLLTSAADASMNAMRVWGGGVYESEDFYDLTDELGILIWQDLMFSVAFYPTNHEFLDTVTKEVRHQVRRLMHRPSILLWAGSNENEKALRQNWFGVKNYTLYYEDYVKLYVTTIMPVVRGENPGRVYLTSSPSDGKETVKEGYVAKDPGSELYGDIHFYDYAMDQWVPDKFRIPRFASEYGIEAWCNFETLRPVFKASDMSYCSPQADHRQHHLGGSTEMEAEILRHLALPPSSTPEPLRFKNFIYLTQINQAMSIKSQSEHYRRHQGSLLADGRGLTMGALYWQLNDIWQAPTWASIDYSGRWKMLQYYAVKFFSPVLISPFMTKGSDIDIFMVVDQIPTIEKRDRSTGQLMMKPMTDFREILHSAWERDSVLDLAVQVGHEVSGVLTVQMYSWDSFTPLHTWTVPYKLGTTAESVWHQDLSSLLAESGCPSADRCFLHTYAKRPEDGLNNWLYLKELKDSNLQKANVSIVTVSQDSDRLFTIHLSTSAIAPFVWLEAGSILGRFSDNGFLLHQPTGSVRFLAWEDVDYPTLTRALTVASLTDVYGDWPLL